MPTENTSTKHSTTFRTTEVIAGLTVLAFSGIVSFVSVVYGYQALVSQIKDPMVGGLLWIVAPIGAVVLASGGALFVAMIGVGVIGSFSEPKILGTTEYSLVGIGGVAGTVASAAVIFRMSDWITQTVGINIATGEPNTLASVVAIAAPISILFTQVFRGASSMTMVSQSKNPRPPSPEAVGEMRQHRQKASGKSPSSTPSPQTQTSQKEDTGGRESPFEELEYSWQTETDVSFDDIGGMNDLKTELKTDVIKPLTTGREMAEELDIPVPNIVFHGPPGTGKTYMAKALATELRLPFVHLSGSDVQSKWINESATKIGTVFEEAKTVAEHEGGAVIFLDELDSVLKSRGEAKAHEEDNKVVNEFLNHLQETGDHNIVFIGATNRIESLDEAGVRSGRIDKKIRVGKPDMKARKKILQAQLDGRPHSLTSDHFSHIAKNTEGMVASDLESIVVDAARHSAFEREDGEILWDDIEAALKDH